MSDIAEAPQRRRGPSPALFFYVAACAILVFGIIATVNIGSEPTCDGPYYPSGDTCVSYVSGSSGITPEPATQAPSTDSKWDIRAEIILASIVVASIVASYGARWQRREERPPIGPT